MFNNYRTGPGHNTERTDRHTNRASLKLFRNTLRHDSNGVKCTRYTYRTYIVVVYGVITRDTHNNRVRTHRYTDTYVARRNTMRPFGIIIFYYLYRPAGVRDTIHDDACATEMHIYIPTI